MIAPQFPLPQTVTLRRGPLFELRGLYPRQVEEIAKRLVIRNRRQDQARHFSGWKDTSQPDNFFGYEIIEGGIAVAPGALEMALTLAWRDNPLIQLKVDELEQEPPQHSLSFSSSDPCEAYQEDAVAQASSSRRGIIVGPCGSGKTRMATRLMASKGVRWLVIVHTKELTNQWVAAIERYTGVKPSEYSTTRKKRFDPANPFVIARVQALRRHLDCVIELALTRGGVLVDEAHHTPAGTFVDVLRYLPCQYRFGFTATPERQDGTTELMHWYLGPEIARVERSDTEAAGRTLRPQLVPVVTSYADTYDPDEPGDNARLLRRMYEDGQRLRLVVDTIAHAMVGRRAGIVITDSIPYGYAILAGLEQVGTPAAFCHGQLSKKDRAAALASVDTGAARVLIATSLADEGLDIPHLDTCFLVTPCGHPGRVEQRWGRVARACEGKLQPVVYHFVDPDVTREDPETGRIISKFVSKFRRVFAGAYRDKADYNPALIRQILGGSHVQRSAAA